MTRRFHACSRILPVLFAAVICACASNSPASRLSTSLDNPDLDPLFRSAVLSAIEKRAAILGAVTCTAGPPALKHGGETNTPPPETDVLFLERDSTRKGSHQESLAAELPPTLTRETPRAPRLAQRGLRASTEAIDASSSASAQPESSSAALTSGSSEQPAAAQPTTGLPPSLTAVACKCEDYDCVCERTCSCRLLGDGSTRIAGNASTRVLPPTAQSPAIATADTGIGYLFRCGCGFSVEAASPEYQAMDCSCEEDSGQGCKCQRRCTCGSRTETTTVTLPNAVPTP
jgi:hypothetical protein